MKAAGAPKRAVLYARVSTDDQTVENQLAELRARAERAGWVITAEFIDHGISGAKGRDKRPAFDRMLKAAVRHEFDVLAAWSVDRLGRSLLHLIGFLTEIHAHRIDLYLHQHNIDTTTPAGKMLFQMLGTFAEFEHSMMKERIRAGIARAKKAGKRLGRPPCPPDKIRRIKMLRKQGYGIARIRREVSVGTGTVQKVVASMGAQ